jgi:acyl-CoA synthetase (AMP-forming)/AMP-acid ligase II
MNERWMGARTRKLRFVDAGGDEDRERLEDWANLARAPRATLERMMEDTLARARERALRSPMHAPTRAAWQAIGGLEDLTRAPCSSSNLLPSMSAEGPDWSRWVADPREVTDVAATSGSSGASKVMPFADWSVRRNMGEGSAPGLATALLKSRAPRRGVGLALTAPREYITYLAVPSCLTTVGCDVLHVPLAAVLREPDVARDLVDWLLVPGNDVRVLITVTTMVPMLLAALEAQPSGAEAVARLLRSLHVLVLGGTEMTPTVHTQLTARLGDRAAAITNLFASTEGGILGLSSDEHDVFHPSLHTSALTILPLEETEKADGDPGYAPRGVLLTRAPAGLVGELAITCDGVVPWINLRQGDVFEVVEPAPGFGAPGLRYRARMSAVQDVGGGRVWPASYERAVQRLEGRVTDYLAMALKPGDRADGVADEALIKDRLAFAYEGVATADDVVRAVLEAVPMLRTTGPELGAGTFDMIVLQLRPGTLAGLRRARSAERGGAPGPLKHTVVRGPQYHLSREAILASRFGW